MIYAWLFSTLSFAQDPQSPETPETPETPEPQEHPPSDPPVEEPAPVEPATLTPVPVPEVTEESTAIPEESPEEPSLPVVPEPPSREDPLPFGVNVEFGWLNNSSPAYDVLAETNGMMSFGLSGGARFARNLVAVGGWHQVRQGAEVYAGGGYSTYSYASTSTADADFESQQLVFRSSVVSNELTLGLRADIPAEDIVFPYVSAQGMLMSSVIRLDDEPKDRRNPTQVKESAMHLGGLLTGGLELRIPPESRVQTSLSAELGYCYLSRASFGDLGDMRPGGFVARLGWGVRF